MVENYIELRINREKKYNETERYKNLDRLIQGETEKNTTKGATSD